MILFKCFKELVHNFETCYPRTKLFFIRYIISLEFCTSQIHGLPLRRFLYEYVYMLIHLKKTREIVY